MTSGRAWKGCPPWTNLRRGPWGPPGRHDTPFSPQMDARDDLRAGLEGVPSRDHAEPQSAWPLEPATRLWSIASKNLPRRYGPREGTPSNPPSPMWHRPPRSKTRPHLRLRTDLIGHGAWTKGNRSEDGEGTLFSVVHRAERRVGAGDASAEPYLLGSFFEAPDHHLVAGSSGHGDCGSACSAEAAPAPARRLMT